MLPPFFSQCSPLLRFTWRPPQGTGKQDWKEWAEGRGLRTGEGWSEVLTVSVWALEGALPPPHSLSLSATTQGAQSRCPSKVTPRVICIVRGFSLTHSTGMRPAPYALLPPPPPLSLLLLCPSSWTSGSISLFVSLKLRGFRWVPASAMLLSLLGSVCL